MSKFKPSSVIQLLRSHSVISGANVMLEQTGQQARLQFYQKCTHIVQHVGLYCKTDEFQQIHPCFQYNTFHSMSV